MDPSGTFIQYEAKAIGSGSEGAQQSLQEVYHKVGTAMANHMHSGNRKAKIGSGLRWKGYYSYMDSFY